MLRYGKKVRKNQRSLQALLALQIINEPICNIVEKKFETLRSLWLKEAKHKGSPCVSCETQNLVQCPTKSICYGNPCKYHDTSEHQPRACQSLSKSCEYFKTQIVNSHRSGTPNWRMTDAKLWSKNATEIAKCFLPQLKGKKTYSADEGTDCLSLLHILRNCKHFQDYFSFDVTGSKNILSQIEKEKMNYNLGYENTPFVQPQSKRRSVDELGPAVKRLKSYPSYKSGISSATFALEKQLESKHMFYHCTSYTEDQQPYEYCMKRVQMALSKWSCTEKVYNGKFELFASKAEYLETLLDNSCRFKQKAVSDVLRTPGSPVLLIVSASDQDKIERFCSQITSKEEEGKHVCVAIVSDRTSIDELCMNQTSLVLFKKCSNISTLRADVDQLFERFIFNFYETNLHLYFEQKDITEKREEEMIKEALTLFRRFKIEIPVWLEEYGRDFEHKDSTQRLISDFKPAMRRFKQLPFVFDCVPRTGHMIIKLKETDKVQENEQFERYIKHILNDCKLPEERYQITFVTVTKYADYKYKSGDEVQVKDRTGTLSGFAKMSVSNSNDLVAILSNHVAEDPDSKSKTFSTALKMQKETVGDICSKPKGDLKADVAIAKIDPCKHSDCDKKFRDEKEKRLYAVPLTEAELDDSKYERVHFWGAKTKPGIGQIQEVGALHEGGSNHIYINNTSENGNDWQKGDSGAMFLKEKHGGESTLQAVGMFMGETFNNTEGRKYIATPLHLGLAVLSETHNATFSLFGEDSEDHENSQ
ncbi:hypothetical protein MAR_002149 [Mya arenaria]|uniref:Uncharacterized protein n=1 Tax=Mya arenaria TaxID=6604 RepID=A0ABY7FH96_MYAAR|nr:uncharacterized protein LOC128209507 isoform X2 [Mya arenaria]WAR20311.1 hypothetical protein MAR_002149 [Mya arenaria]